MKECINYSTFESGDIQCNTCEHRCRIKEGRTGICGIRKNTDRKLCLLTYGRAAAAHVDPMEKKPLFHFLPAHSVYSFGTIGCNFRCGNCQNFGISQMFGAKGEVTQYDSLHWGYKMEPETIVREAQANQCAAIAYTYNEPTISMEYMLDTMKLAKKSGLKNVWVSNGYMTDETLDAIEPCLDAINVDIKSLDDKFYRKQCGASLEPVLRACRRLVKKGVWLEVTTLIIPTLSDNEGMLKRIAEFIYDDLGSTVPWHLSAFAGEISWKMKSLPATSLETIRQTYEIGAEIGLSYVYGGNIMESSMQNTYCPRCREVVIRRNGYEIQRRDLGGACPKCGEIIAGVF